MTAALAAFVHLVAIGVALTAMLMRGVALHGEMTPDKRRVALLFDTLSGVAAAVMIGAGLWRLFGGLAKPVAWYVENDAFWLKMTLLALLLAVELVPMSILIQWRTAMARAKRAGGPVRPEDLWSHTGTLVSRLSFVEFTIGVGIVLTATAMARGVGMQLF